MKYFIDTEFIEGFHKPMFGKRRHHIDLISIGIYAEDGRAYYAISREYNFNDADPWVQANVIMPMYIKAVSGDPRNHCTAETFQWHYGKPNKIIKEEVYKFILPYVRGLGSISNGEEIYLSINPPEFYGYYADYDWVVFCSLFGRMIDLPKGFPMYCRDLKQIFDSKISEMEIAAIGYEAAVKRLKNKEGYPVQKDEHNALSDAKWNYELYKWLNKF